MTSDEMSVAPPGEPGGAERLLQEATRPGRVTTVRVAGAVTVVAGVLAAAGLYAGAPASGRWPGWAAVIAVVLVACPALTARALLRYPSARDRRADRGERVRAVAAGATPWLYALVVAIACAPLATQEGFRFTVGWVLAALVAAFAPAVARLAAHGGTSGWDDGPPTEPLVARGAAGRLARSARTHLVLITVLAVVLVVVAVAAATSTRLPGGSTGWAALVVAGVLAHGVALTRMARSARTVRRAVDDDRVDRETVHAGLAGTTVTRTVAVVGGVLTAAGAAAAMVSLARAGDRSFAASATIAPVVLLALSPMWLLDQLPARVRVLTGITGRNRPSEGAAPG